MIFDDHEDLQAAYAEEMTKRIALEAEVAELRRDREMLDFLEQRGSLSGITWFATETLREALARFQARQTKALRAAENQ